MKNEQKKTERNGKMETSLTFEERISRLRNALCRVLGANTKKELEEMLAVFISIPGTDNDKRIAINCLHVLLDEFGRLRNALSEMVGVETKEQLEGMLEALNSIPGYDKDKEDVCHCVQVLLDELNLDEE